MSTTLCNCLVPSPACPVMMVCSEVALPTLTGRGCLWDQSHAQRRQECLPHVYLQRRHWCRCLSNKACT